jgi:pyruvate/2-oxoglutarate dehydrogenase complex dihydrolipoamide dehydrogenase (E3) component
VAVADARRVAGARQAVTGTAEASAAFARRDRYTADWNDEGQANWLKTGAELIRGHGRQDGPRRVRVEAPGGETAALTARHAVVICTGSRPPLPGLAGLDQVRPWTNRQATESHAVPERLAIAGGGGVGVEMASAWAGLGAAVTLLAQDGGLLPALRHLQNVRERSARGRQGELAGSLRSEAKPQALPPAGWRTRPA